MKICIINQTAGIGDIFYTQKIAKEVIRRKKADKIIWPVIDNFIYIKDYLKFNGIEYIEQSKFIKPKDCFEVNLQSADQRHPGSVMLAKYKEVGLSQNGWLDYFDFKRNLKREKLLFNKLKIEQDYIVRNMYYGSPPQPLKHHVPYTGNKQIIDIDFYEGINLFDWCKILEGASELHMVETSFLYILEKLNIKSKVNKLYSRFKPANFNHIKHIPKKVDWEYTQW